MSAASISANAVFVSVFMSILQSLPPVTNAQLGNALVEELEDEAAHCATTNLLQNSLQKLRAEPPLGSHYKVSPRVHPGGEKPRPKQSHDNGSSQLLFVHIPKNAGSTIENTGKAYGFAWGSQMFNHSEPRFQGWQTMPDGNKCKWGHVPPSLLEFTPNPYDGAEVFCVSRDPFDRAVSEYLWVRAEKFNFGCPRDDPLYKYATGEPRHEPVKEVPGCATIPTCSAEGLNFYVQETLRTWLDGQEYMNGCHVLPQSWFIWGPDDSKTWCQDILRLEELDKDFSELMEASGLDVELTKEVNVAAKHCVNLTTDALNEESKRLIRLVYKEDFERLHYDLRF